MSRCNRCNIEVEDDSMICPLCKGALAKTNGEEKVSMYPDMFPKIQRMRLALRIVTFCAIVGILILGIVNYLTYKGVKWSLVGLAGIVYVYLTFAFTVQPLADKPQKIMFQGVITMALAVSVDFSLGYRGWSVNLAIPATLLVLDLTVFVFMLASREDWRSYITTQLELTVLAAILLLLISLEVVTWKLFSVIVIFVVLVQLLGVFLIGGRGTTLEINRRFRA